MNRLATTAPSAVVRKRGGKGGDSLVGQHGFPASASAHAHRRAAAFAESAHESVPVHVVLSIGLR